jgi:hypothetical protein
MNLYEIDSEIRALLDAMIDPETGELIEEDLLDDLNALEATRKEKIESTALYAKSQRAFALAIAGEISALNTRKKAAEKRAEWTEKYLSEILGGEKFDTPKVSISWKKTQAVKITDMLKLPKQYLRYKDPEPDKATLNKELKAGKKIAGAELVTNLNMILK